MKIAAIGGNFVVVNGVSDHLKMCKIIKIAL
jgi:hypothetical protein